MLRGDDLNLFIGSSYEHASGQVVGPSEEAAGVLLYGGNSQAKEKVPFDTYDFEVVQEGGFIDDEDGCLLAVLGALQNLFSDKFEENGPGEAGCVHFELDADLPVEFQDGAL
ncbi:hypothetical protein DFAR_1440003 [Desulfarculales bacterium]